MNKIDTKDLSDQAASYDDLQVGTSWSGSASSFRITQSLIDDYRDATLDTSSAAVPSTLAAVYVLEHMRSRKTPPGGIHAKQHFRFHRALRVGDVLKTTAIVTDKYEKNGRRYVVTESTTVDTAGETVTTGRMTSIWGKE
jgi:hypothetical protein